MNALFASAALGLVAAWPASGLGWMLGKAADKLTGDPLARATAWNRAVALPPTLLGLMVGISALPKAATDPVYQVALTSKTVASAGAAMTQASAQALSGVDAVEAVGAILILGALGGLAVTVARQRIGRTRLKRIVAAARPASQELTLAVRAAARRLDTLRPEVKISDDIDQPMLAGLTTPTILLPAEMVARLDVRRLAPICAHELAHLKRGDNWRQLAEHLLGGLFWMVPPFAAIRARAAATREELSDALALDGASPTDRRGYAETLIAVLRHRAAPALHPAFTGKGRKPTAMRLKAITDPRDPASHARRALLGLAGLLAMALAVGASIALAQQAEPHSNTHTVITDDATGQYVDIRSDYVRVTDAELVNGRLKVADGKVSTYHGNVEVRGRLRPPATIVLLNGETPPPGFDPTTLPRGAINQVQVVNRMVKDHSQVTLNIIMKPSV